MTWAELGTLALRRLGYLAAGETAASEDAAHVFQTLQVLIGSMATERLTIHEVTRTTWSITANDGVYTVGPTGDVAIVRPMFVQTINFIDTSQDPDLELPLGLLTDDAYAAIPQKSLTAVYPAYAYYNPTFGANGLATITLWQIPTSTTLQGCLYHPTAVVEPSSSAATILLPPGYLRYLRDTLAIEIAGDFDAIVSQDLRDSAATATADVKRSNIRLADLSIDTALVSRDRKANIYTGSA